MKMLWVLLVAVSAGVYAFFRFYPAFGGRTPRTQRARSAQFNGNKFVNLIPTPMNIGFWGALKILRQQLRNDPLRRPNNALTPEHPDLSRKPQAPIEVVWFGHSAFLVRIGGKTLLLDPMLGRAPSPFPALGPQRFSHELPLSIEELPAIDVICISHDHYDHLDYPSIKLLTPKVGMFLVPIGLGAHLRRWGVPAEKISELDWWDEQTHAGLQFACTPSRHFSGRTLTDRNDTLWASWVVIAGKSKLYFSGDTGYGPHFKDIGEKYGPFDLTLLECGQYNEQWANIHMMPEQTVQAHLDLRGKVMIPMHWGAFVLALHSWTDPVTRALAAGQKVGARIVTPKIGEVVTIPPKGPSSPWWT